MIQEKSCGAVVFKRDSEVGYLLLRYGAGHWDFVKGNVETNESERGTVMRELKEETGISEAGFVDGFRVRIEYFYRRQGETIRKEVVFFLVEAKTSVVKLSFEHVDYAWLNYQQATERLTFRNAKDVLMKANTFLHAKSSAESSP